MIFKRDSCCEEYIDQLIPSSTPITKIKLKLFGSSAAGKSSLVESLKAGYLTGLFRRSRRSSSSRNKERRGGSRNSNNWCTVKIMICFRIASITSASSVGGANGTAKTSLDAVHDHYTKGIEVQQVSEQTCYFEYVRRRFASNLILMAKST